ncbi:glycosyltransferase family 4 protein (plasmid) [Shinella sp. H4-D48]|uniref:glycosyltransferase family 4 protein n=1 Tax=unclassified Shinella TaxID=2643062 RepID=UPI001F533479|nr:MULTISPECIES: glycosyltransferase family 4 protein [unclassified Shinella]UNK40449.1 glycosyltransferase family 4 protein [Shinella sp. H4-D48]
MKIAYFVLPHLGGTYTVFRNLRAGLAPHGIELCWLGLVPVGQGLAPGLEREAAFGTLVEVPSQDDDRVAARLMEKAILAGAFDGVVVNVLSDRIQTNIVRYLPADLLRLMVVHNITPGTYAAAEVIQPHVHATVCVSQRCRDDLVKRHHFPAMRTSVIANAVAIDAFSATDRSPRPIGQGLRLLFLGRIEDASKGVLWLPDILTRLPASSTLTIAGEGPDLRRLKAVMPEDAPRVIYAGPVAAQAVPALLARHDIFLMPSRYEGLPMALVEAMAAGCVPVASRIRGVTEMIIEHGRDGLLFPVGDTVGVAEIVRALDKDRARLGSLSAAARRKVEGAFTVERMAADYAAILRGVAADPPPIAAPLPMDAWSMPRGLRAGLRTFLPRPVKNWLRGIRERL